MSTLACGLSNGIIILVDVAQELLVPPGSPSSLETTMAIRDKKVVCVIGGLDGALKYVDPEESGLSSRGLSALMRNLPPKNEGRVIANVATGKVSGMTSIHNGSILLWTFE